MKAKVKWKRFIIVGIALAIICILAGVGIWYAESRVYSRIDAKEKEQIEQNFQITLPKRCEIVSYDVFQEERYKDSFVIALKMNATDKKYMLEQLEDKYEGARLKEIEYMLHLEDCASRLHSIYLEEDSFSYKNLRYQLNEVSDFYTAKTNPYIRGYYSSFEVEEETKQTEENREDKRKKYQYICTLKEKRGSFMMYLYYYIDSEE